MQIEPRENVSVLRAGLAPIVAVLAAMALCSVLIVWAGAPVFEAYFLCCWRGNRHRRGVHHDDPEFSETWPGLVHQCPDGLHAVRDCAGRLHAGTTAPAGSLPVQGALVPGRWPYR